MRLLLFLSASKSNDLITKRYHVPPEFFGGPLDVGYYIGRYRGRRTTGQGGQSGYTGVAEAPPVSSNVLEKEAVSFQNGRRSRLMRWCYEPGKPVARHCPLLARL